MSKVVRVLPPELPHALPTPVPHAALRTGPQAVPHAVPHSALNTAPTVVPDSALDTAPTAVPDARATLNRAPSAGPPSVERTFFLPTASRSNASERRFRTAFPDQPPSRLPAGFQIMFPSLRTSARTPRNSALPAATPRTSAPPAGATSRNTASRTRRTALEDAVPEGAPATNAALPSAAPGNATPEGAAPRTTAPASVALSRIGRPRPTVERLPFGPTIAGPMPTFRP